MAEFYFTITAGRTGTSWFANFIKNNLNIYSIHEPLSLEDYGTQMPDIKTLRTFNTHGMNETVKQFWGKKFSGIRHHKSYFESNHTLAKCGLLEYSAEHCGSETFTFFCLRRNHVKQCASYYNRHDFKNITLLWQWFLDPGYPKKIINPRPLLQLGPLGAMMWYIYEIEARQEYYKLMFKDTFRFIDLDLESMTTPAGAKALLKKLGIEKEPVMPDKKNANPFPLNPELEEKIKGMFNKTTFDPAELAKQYVESGFRLV